MFKSFFGWLVVGGTLLLPFSEVAFGDTGLLSSVNGLGALNHIASDPELRKKISITDYQLSEIRAILDNKHLFVGDESENNEVGKTYLKKILRREQADLMRMEIVKSRIGVPSNFFLPNMLMELGLNRQESLRIYSEFAKLESSLVAESDERRVLAINKVLPEHIRNVFWKFVGQDFVLGTAGGKIDEVNLFLELTPLAQISLAAYTEVPHSLLISVKKREQLSEMSVRLHRDQIDGKVYSSAELEGMLDEILTPTQRFAVVQSINRSFARKDLLLAVSPHLTDCYQLSESVLSELVLTLAQHQKALKEWGDLKELEMCRKCMKEIPPECQSTVKELAQGIWEL